MWTINADGSGRLRSLGRGANPIWSPNGRRLSFMNTGHHAGQLWFVRADGSHRHPASLHICDDPSLEGGGGVPTDWYRSNGSWMLLTSDCPTGSRGSIWKVRADGSDPQLVVGDPTFDDSYYGGRMSPDGGTVAYTRFAVGSDGGSTGIGREGTLGYGYFLHQFSASQCYINGAWYCEATTPTWSPDGTQVAYGVSGSDDVRCIALLDVADQTAPVLLVDGWQPIWSGAAAA